MAGIDQAVLTADVRSDLIATLDLPNDKHRRALQLIDENVRMTSTMLAAALDVSPSIATELVRWLRQMGLIKLAPGEVPRHGYFIDWARVVELVK